MSLSIRTVCISVFNKNVLVIPDRVVANKNGEKNARISGKPEKATWNVAG